MSIALLAVLFVVLSLGITALMHANGGGWRAVGIETRAYSMGLAASFLLAGMVVVAVAYLSSR